MKDTDRKCSKLVEKTAQSEEDFYSRTSSLESSLNAEKDCISQLENDCVGKAAGNKDVLAI